MKLIDIAMATYNGEAFILEQITSIRNQSYSNWRLLISDDGSSDNTVAIIKKIMLEDKRVILVNVSRQGGVIKNFNRVLLETSAEYVALSDQDDIWPSDRLEIMQKKIESFENKYPEKKILVFTDLTLINDKNELISSSFYKENGLDPLLNIKGNNLLWRCSVYGCTTIMNRNLLNTALPIPDYALMHDHWLALQAYKNTGLYYFDYLSILYRQHTNNVVGGSRKDIIGKIKAFRKSFKIISLQAEKTRMLLLESNPSDVNGHVKSNIRMKFIYFACKEIFPNIFVGHKKIHSFFTFMSFVMRK